MVMGTIALASVLMLGISPPAFASTTTATFSGTAKVHLVLVDGGQMTISGVPFSVVVTAGGAGVGTLFLTLVNLPPPFGTVTVGGLVASGLIIVTPGSTHGGGTIAPPQASQDGFGVTWQSGGQFQCQNAGFSALLGIGIRQMDVHGTVPAGALIVS